MRSIVTILSFILLCIQLSAQEKIEALKLISDICEKNISIDDFKKQYSDYFIINHDTDSTDSGLFMAHLQSSVFKLSKDLIDSIHEEGIVAYTS